MFRDFLFLLILSINIMVSGLLLVLFENRTIVAFEFITKTRYKKRKKHNLDVERDTIKRIFNGS